ncbi:unnamed protein product [Tenebrio molitor]|nr:unnamed protein product [Tenebrio molitor]
MFSFIEFSVLFDLLLALSFTSLSYYHYIIFSSSPFLIFHFPFQSCYSLRHVVVFLFLPFFSLFLNSSLSRSISLLSCWFSFRISFISTFISSRFSTGLL